MPDRVPVLKFEASVIQHDTKEPASNDKPDVFTVTLKSFEKDLKIGTEDAKAKLTIKALDDIVKHNFPLYGSFVIEIYVKPRSAPVEKPKTEPTTLDEK